MIINFQKWQGLGNDFVIMDNRALAIPNIGDEYIKALCQRNFGIGCDQLIIINPSQSTDCEMIIYNVDGSKSDACGNATRCVARILNKKEAKIKIGNRTLHSTLFEDGNVKVHMGQAEFGRKMLFPKTPFKTGYEVDVGNPHLVFFIESLENLDIKKWGPYFCTHPDFPNQTNVEFAKVLSDSQVSMRVWERGVGETLACGTGACALTAAGFENSILSNSVAVQLKGGTLNIEIVDKEIYMMGNAVKVFEGSVSYPEFI